jgi:hypothetical protein
MWSLGRPACRCGSASQARRALAHSTHRESPPSRASPLGSEHDEHAPRRRHRDTGGATSSGRMTRPPLDESPRCAGGLRYLCATAVARRRRATRSGRRRAAKSAEYRDCGGVCRDLSLGRENPAIGGAPLFFRDDSVPTRVVVLGTDHRRLQEFARVYRPPAPSPSRLAGRLWRRSRAAHRASAAPPLREQPVHRASAANPHPVLPQAPPQPRSLRTREQSWMLSKPAVGDERQRREARPRRGVPRATRGRGPRQDRRGRDGGWRARDGVPLRQRPFLVSGELSALLEELYGIAARRSARAIPAPLPQDAIRKTRAARDGSSEFDPTCGPSRRRPDAAHPIKRVAR